MGSARHRSTLGEHIAAALNNGRTKNRRNSIGHAAVINAKRTVACTGIALLAMNPVQVGAVGLGEINIQSGLGQPLRATVPMTIGAGESVNANCVKTTENGPGSLGSPPNTAVTAPRASSPGSYKLRIETANPLYEPMYELSLLVDCPGTAILVRHYVLMLDLPGMTMEPQTTVTSQNAPAVSPVFAATPVVAAPRAPQPTVQRATPSRVREPIPAAIEYRVQQGDTLSTIAARIVGRPRNATWDVAMQIFARNPEAFIRANPDLIKLGEIIRIPTVAEMQLATGVTVADLATPAPERIPDPTPYVEPKPEAIIRQQDVSVSVPVEPVAEIQRNPTSNSLTPAVTPATAEVSPFVDEKPAPVTVAKPETTPPAVETVLTVADDNQSSGDINPFVAIGLGILLGFALSLLIVRGRIIEMLAGLLNRKAPPAPLTPAKTEVDTFNEFDATASDFQGATTNDFDDSAAKEAFATQPGNDPDASPFQLGKPAEDTYIVEVSESAQSAADTEGSGGLFAPPTSMTLEDSLAELDPQNVDLLIETDNTPDAYSGAPEDTMLAQLFNEDLDPTAVATPEAMSELSTGNLEPTAEMPAGNLEPTAEVPVQNLEPTAELPSHFVDPSEVIDPTAEMPLEERAAQMSMTQSFSENLERLDLNKTTEEEFATNKPTAEISSTNALKNPEFIATGELTSEINLEELVKGASEDETLSQTLHEALTLLERDYEDEFTASQILERKEIEKALEGDEEDAVAARKVSK